ncbi:MarR family transcriptional regulator [Gordoniibacillus kamchatkensis]|uniref:MarR family transcriptional regulator n=1 Tax=Gordoniibacillus kamchatkensis TaxID=1590651 RepID=UPI000695C73B|nr:MarR family transcriptional regulator [Paenibacillus sp. VKM B-2647]
MNKQPPSADRFFASFQQVQQLLRQQLQAHLQRQSGDRPLTRGQFYLLRYLYANGPLTMTDLASWSRVTPATMSTLADRLAKHGWIERRKSGDDRRVVKLQLTEAGGAFIRASKLVAANAGRKAGAFERGGAMDAYRAARKACRRRGG